MNTTTTFKIESIGKIKRMNNKAILSINEKYIPGLKQLSHFSHVMVFWWAHKFDTDEYKNLLQMEPPYAKGNVTGVFASRSPFRPNLIAMTTCPIIKYDEENGEIEITGIDAFDDTDIIDLKAYFPVCDRVQEAIIPEWLSDWPDWMPEEGMDLEEYEK
ncbi:TrmO family methyltransferase [Bacteroidota bacterium]